MSSNRLGSAHTGVTNFVFGDGRVKAVRNTASLETLTRLVTRNDGLVLNGEF